MTNTSSRDLGTTDLNPISQHHQNDTVSVSHNQPSQSRSLNLPCQDLLNGRREDYNAICVPLYNAIANRKPQAVKAILDNRPELVRFSIIESYDTALHIAVLKRSFGLLDYLINLMTKEDLELQNGNGETAFSLLARAGDVVTAKILMERNKSLIDIPDSQGRMPLYVAALFERRNMVRYLYSFAKEMSEDSWTHENQSLVLEKCVEANIFDVALQMVTDSPQLAINGNVLRLLAQKPEAFRAKMRDNIRSAVYSSFAVYHIPCELPYIESEVCFQLLRIVLEEIMKMPKAQIDDIMRGPPDLPKEDENQTLLEKETREALQLLRNISENTAKMSAKSLDIDEEAMTSKEAKQKYSSRVLFLAAKMGNITFIAEVIRQYPNLAMDVNDDNHSIFHVGVLHRHLGIYRLLRENDHIMDSVISLEDQSGNNMLHLVGETATDNRIQTIRGMGVLLNREVHWFKRVESILPSHLQRKKNTAGLTAKELFIKNHKDLHSNDEKLMKEMSTQLMVVAALIATISFAAVFTFPGGYNQDTGIPLFLRKTLFKIFIIFDSLSFISSTTSILVVLSIILADHDAHDFMNSSPKQITLCLALVIISIGTIIVTFIIALFLHYQSSSRWLPVLVSTFAIMPYMAFGLINEFIEDRFIMF